MRQTVVAIAIGTALLVGGVLLYRHFARSKTADTGHASATLPAFAEQSNRAVPDTARLYSFFWRQSSENADACFAFSLGAAQESAEADGHYLNCTFRAPDGAFVEHRDVPVPEGRWRELEAALRRLALPPYAPPDPHLLDATDSRVEIGWTENGNRFTNRYSGEYAHELRTFLTTFIGQITA